MDVRTFGPFWAEFARDFMGYAAKHAGEDLAEDAMQDTFIRASQLLPKYTHINKKGLFGWLLQILHRVCAETKRRKETKHRHDEWKPARENAAGSSPSPESVLDAARAEQERENLRYLIETADLSEMQRVCLKRHANGESTESIAHGLIISEANVRANPSVAIRNLQAAAAVSGV